MNTNPKAKRVLCYGDSLTYGHDPETNTRLDINKRWTGVLQSLLGNNYEIIEEGLGGRTTNLEDPNSPHKNGLIYFPSFLMSHFPLDIIIILLGTNNLKGRFSQNPSQIAESLLEYVKHINDLSVSEETSIPKLIIAAPPLVIEKFVPQDWDFQGGEIKSKQLATEYLKITQKVKAEFINLSDIYPSQKDGVHLNEKGNKMLAEKIYKHICKY